MIVALLALTIGAAPFLGAALANYLIRFTDWTMERWPPAE